MGRNKTTLHKEFVVDGVSKNDTSRIWNSFCSYFIDHPRYIYNAFSFSSSYHLHQIEFYDGSIFFRHVTETETVESIMCHIREGGINDVSLKLLHMCQNHVAYHLKVLLNFFYDLGCLSKHFINILKGSPHDICNYRPVSVLSNLSKVFENTVYNSLQNGCQTSKFLGSNSSRFP